MPVGAAGAGQAQGAGPAAVAAAVEGVGRRGAGGQPLRTDGVVGKRGRAAFPLLFGASELWSR